MIETQIIWMPRLLRCIYHPSYVGSQRRHNVLTSRSTRKVLLSKLHSAFAHHATGWRHLLSGSCSFRCSRRRRYSFLRSLVAAIRSERR